MRAHLVIAFAGLQQPYSFGVTLLLMLLGEDCAEVQADEDDCMWILPRSWPEAQRTEELKKLVQRGRLSQEALDLLERLLVLSPSRRSRLADGAVKQHAFFLNTLQSSHCFTSHGKATCCFIAMEEAEEDAGDGPIDLLKAWTFDRYDVAERCKELMRRLSNSAGSPQCKWDILELMEESHHQLRDVRQVHSDPDRGIWQEPMRGELQSAVGNEHTASTLPVSLRKQCEEILARRKIWLGDFDTELNAILARGKEVRERLLFEDMDRASWFSAAGVSSLEVQRLLERHAEMHQRAARLARQLKLLSRGLQQQGALSSRSHMTRHRRRAFQAKTVGEKLQSSLVCLAAVAVAPVPGSSEMMWLDKDQAWQHVVYEHPRDAETDTILDQFQCRSSKATCLSKHQRHHGVDGHSMSDRPQAKPTNGRTRKKRFFQHGRRMCPRRSRMSTCSKRTCSCQSGWIQMINSPWRTFGLPPR
eukprot:g15025.t1